MRKEKRWRYFCDHCKKSGSHGGHMNNHEAGCTLNPNRKCRVCDVMQFDAKPLPELVKFVQKNSVWFDSQFTKGHGYLELNDEFLIELRELADNCPACILAALRQGKAIASYEKFDFKKEMKSHWQSYNESKEPYY